jgi:ABC-type amino acid transport substrate-binding protein
MIPGKRFGYQDHTTSEKIVQQLKQKYAFDPHAFDRPEKMLTALLNRDIDLALVDAPFAVDAQRTTRQRGKDRLDLKQFSARDFPESVADKDRFDEYAIGVRVSDELLPLINDSLQKFRADGTLPRLFQTAVREFARGKGTGVPEAGHPLARERLWECPR